MVDSTYILMFFFICLLRQPRYDRNIKLQDKCKKRDSINTNKIKRYKPTEEMEKKTCHIPDLLQAFAEKKRCVKNGFISSTCMTFDFISVILKLIDKLSQTDIKG